MKAIYRVPLVLLTTAAAVSLGVVGVHASTQCVRFVQQKVRHRKVTAATAARWAAWNKAHPNYHPKRTPEDTLAQIDFACKVPTEEKTPTELLPPVELGTFGMPREMSAPPTVSAPSATPVTVATNAPPPDLFPLQPSDSIVTPPIYPPEYPVMFGPIGTVPLPSSQTPLPPVGPTPEPAGWVLMATAAAAIASVAARRNGVEAS